MIRAALQLCVLSMMSALATTSWAGHPDAALLHAALEGDLQGAVDSIEYGGHPDARYGYSNDETPLMIAAREGHVEVIAFLLSRGADPALTLDAPGRPQHGWTADAFASEAGHQAAVEVFRDFERRRRVSAERSGGSDAFGRRLVEVALERTRHGVVYDARYLQIAYPNGDVPANIGVCTDVVVRAYRALGIDLQARVHKEMSANFAAFPNLWGLTHPDPNIDHRRVPNLQRFFERRGVVLPITHESADYAPGDLVTWRVGGSRPHIGIVVRYRSRDGERPLIVHNIGRGPRLEDMLFAFPITGHYRYEAR